MKNLLASILLLLISFSLQAEDRKDKGRLPDGRAYRVDDQGYQLVDYIAELELKVEELENKIIAINNEQKFRNSKSEFAESNLLPEYSDKFENSKPLNPCPKLKCPDATEVCKLYIQDLNQLKDQNLTIQTKYEDRISKLKSEILEKDLLIKNYQNTDSQDLIRDEELRLLRRQVARLEDDLKSKESLLATNEDCQQELNEQATEKSKEILVLQNKNQQLEKELSLLTLELEQARATKSIIDPKQVNFSEVEKPQIIKLENSQRVSAFDHLKGKISEDLTNYQKLLRKRAQLYKTYQGMNISKSVKVTLSSGKTVDGYDLNTLQQELATAQKFSELGKIQKNLFELSRDIRKDLVVLQRVTQR